MGIKCSKRIRIYIDINHHFLFEAIRFVGPGAGSLVFVLRLHSLFQKPLQTFFDCYYEPASDFCALFTFGEIGRSNKPMRHKNTAPLTATKITAGPTSESESSMVAAVKYKQKESKYAISMFIEFELCSMRSDWI